MVTKVVPKKRMTRVVRVFRLDPIEISAGRVHAVPATALLLESRTSDCSVLFLMLKFQFLLQHSPAPLFLLTATIDQNCPTTLLSSNSTL